MGCDRRIRATLWIKKKKSLFKQGKTRHMGDVKPSFTRSVFFFVADTGTD
jgi:hypothetical protein